MSAIADFKKRRQAQRELQNNTTGDASAEKTAPVPENEALQLLAALLGCDVGEAIDLAKQLIEQGAYIAGLTEEQLAAVEEQAAADENIGDETEKAEPQNDTVTADLELAATVLESSASTVEGAAETVTGAAEQISSAAGGLEDTASQLAYSAEDIGQATAELREATAELKKPSAAPVSSRGEKAAPRKSNLKKSG